MCGLEFPDLEQQIWQPLKDQGVTVIGVDTGGLFGQDDATRVRDFIAKTGVSFPVVLDQGQSDYFSSSPGISPYPYDVIVDRNGVVVSIMTQYDPDALRAVVDAAL